MLSVFNFKYGGNSLSGGLNLLYIFDKLNSLPLFQIFCISAFLFQTAIQVSPLASEGVSIDQMYQMYPDLSDLQPIHGLESSSRASLLDYVSSSSLSIGVSMIQTFALLY